MADWAASRDAAGASTLRARPSAGYVSRSHVRHARQFRGAGRQSALPDSYLRELTDQYERFGAIGQSSDTKRTPLAAIEMPEAQKPDDTSVFVPNDALQGFSAAANPARSVTSPLSISGGLTSLLFHGLIAAALVGFGLSVELPAVEGDTVITVTIVGNTTFDDMAAADAAGLAAPEPSKEAPATWALPEAGPVQTPPLVKPLDLLPGKVKQTPALEMPPIPPVSAKVQPAQPNIPQPETSGPPVKSPSESRAITRNTPDLGLPVSPALSSPAPAEIKAAPPPQAAAQMQTEVETPQQSPMPAKSPVKQSREKSAPVAKEPAEPKRTVARKVPAAAKEPVAKPSKSKAAAARRAEAKSAQTRSEKVPPAKTSERAKSGKGVALPTKGKGTVNAKKGVVDGTEKGQAAAKSVGKANGKTGNASASNYAGLVQRKIARTRQRPAGGRGNVVISFSISSSGGLASASVARSSGISAVDAAALDHIRRSAPFPAPPQGAQTRFQVPVTIR
jgi:periplasmic protein TonB